MNHVPCPGRIVSELGDGFSIGVVMGTLWYFMKGAYCSPRDERFRGGLILVRQRAPILGGSFGMWAGIYAASSCVLIYFRQKEDFVNSIVAGGATGFILSIRGGLRRAIFPAISGAVFLGVIELAGVLFMSYSKRQEVIERNERLNAFKRQMERSKGLMPNMSI